MTPTPQEKCLLRLVEVNEGRLTFRLACELVFSDWGKDSKAPSTEWKAGLSKNQAKALANYFHVAADLFI